MITNKRPKKDKIEIDLQGPEGNAFALLGIAKDLCHKTGIEWEPIKNEMTSYKYIGNAVPPLLAYLIANKVEELLKKYFDFS